MALLDARKSSSSWKEVRRAVKAVKGPVLRRQKQDSFPPLPRIQAQECRKCQPTICRSISTVSNAIFCEAARVRTCAARIAHANRSHILLGAFFHSLVEELDVSGALRGTGNCCLQFQHCQNNIGRDPCSATRVNLELNLKCFLRFLSFKMDFVNFISEYATSVGALEVCFSAPQAGRFWRWAHWLPTKSTPSGSVRHATDIHRLIHVENDFNNHTPVCA